jgi:hypothetical protein
MPGRTRIDRRVIGAISTLAIGVVGAVVTSSIENAPGWISTAFVIIAGVAAADLAVEAYYRPSFAALSRTIELQAAAAEEDDDAQRRSRLVKQRDVVLVISVLAGGTLGMIVGVALNGGAS